MSSQHAKWKLVYPELAALARRYACGKTAGMVSTASFLNEFLHMGLKERTKHATAKRSETLAITRRQARLDAKRSVRFRSTEALSGSTVGFDPEDVDTALSKIANVAAFYDASRVNSLAAFEGARMAPRLFREQLRSNLRLQFTPQELSALIDRYDVDGDGSVHCGEFVNEFFRLGRQQRTAHEQQAKDMTRTLNRREKAKHDQLTAKHMQSVAAKFVLPTARGEQGAAVSGDASEVDGNVSQARDFLDEMESRVAKIDRSSYARGWAFSSGS